jgi:hypothetical protein
MAVSLVLGVGRIGPRFCHCQRGSRGRHSPRSFLASSAFVAGTVTS